MEIWKSWLDLPENSAVLARKADQIAFSDRLHSQGRLSTLRFLTEDDLAGSFADDILLHLKTVHGLDPHHAAKILPWLPLIRDDLAEPTPKLRFLQTIRRELWASGKYQIPERIPYPVIHVLNRPEHFRYPDVDLREAFTWPPFFGDIDLTRCPDEESQVHAVIESVARLLTEGTPISAIRIVNATGSDKTRLTLEAGQHGFSVTEERHVPLNRNPAMVRLLRNLGSLPLAQLAEAVISEAESEEERRVARGLVNLLNRYGVHSLEAHPDLFRYEMSVRCVTIPPLENAVLMIGMDEMVPDPQLRHLFLNFSDSFLPPVRKDTDYLSDREKQLIGQPTSLDINEMLRVQTVKLMESIPQISLFYPEKDARGEVRVADLGLSRPLSPVNYTISARPVGYSRSFDRVLFAKRKYSWERFGIRNDDWNRLRATHAASWHAYDPRFNGIRPDTLDSLLHRGVRLSASSLETFYQCRFRYFLKYLLQMEPNETSLELSLGNLAHYVLARAFSGSVSVADLAQEYRTQDPLLREGNGSLLADLFASRLNLVVDRLRSRRDEALFSDFSVEKAYSYLHPEDPNFRILGKIDLVQTYRRDPDVFVSVIDYKTGNNVFRNEDFEKGIDIQLVFYLHLLQKAGAIPGMKAAGFYYQPVNLGKIGKDAKKDPIREKLKMNGMTLKDPLIASAFDPQGDVRGLSRKTDGEFSARAKVVDSQQMESYLARMQRFIDEAVRLIRDGGFDITPLPAHPGRPGSESCEYCPNQGICYLADSGEAENGTESTDGEDE